MVHLDSTLDSTVDNAKLKTNFFLSHSTFSLNIQVHYHDSALNNNPAVVILVYDWALKDMIGKFDKLWSRA